jgi:hypothetical protein
MRREDGSDGLLCGLVVRVPGYRFRGPVSNPGATKYSEKLWVWNGVHSGLGNLEYGHRDPSR